MIAVLGLVVGIVLGLVLRPDVPLALDPYLPIAVVAALDAVFGGLRAYLDGIFDDKVFVISFVSNVRDRVGHRLPRRQARGRRAAVDRRDRGARDPDLLQRGRDSPAPLPCLTRTCRCDRNPTRRPDAVPHPESHAERDDAAPSTAAELREDGRSRLWRAFTSPTRGQVVVGVLLALVGFAAVTQVRSNQVDDTYAGLRQQDLIDILNGLAGTTQRSEDEIERLEATRDDLQSDTSARQAALEQARQQAQVLSILAGTVPVRGAGVTITIEDDAGPVRGRPVHRHGAGAADRGRRGDADQRRGAGGRPDLLRGRHRRGDGRRPAAGGAVHRRRDRPARRLVAALQFPDGPQDQFAEDDGAELTFEDARRWTSRPSATAVEADVAETQQ